MPDERAQAQTPPHPGPFPEEREPSSRRFFSLLQRNPDYRRLFLATVVSYMGDWFAFVAVSGFVTDETGKGGLGAIVYGASVLPVFFLSPLAGVIADRVDRRKMLVTVDLVRIPPALLMVLALWWHSPWLAIACVALLAALSTFFEPISSAVVPNLVDAEDLALAQAALNGTWGTMLFVGAAAGGLVSATLGREASFVLNAATFLVSALCVVGIRRPMQEARVPTEAGFFAHLHEVWVLAKRRSITRALLITKGGVGLANGLVGLLPAYAHARFGNGDAGVGVLLASRGVGAFIGPFLAALFVRNSGRRLLVICGASMVAYGLCYAALPETHTLPFAALCVVLAHLGGGAQWALSTYGLQATTPDAIRGRVMSLDFGLATLAIGISSLAAAGGAELIGVQKTSWILASIAIVYAVGWLIWTRPLWSAAADPIHAPPAD